MFRAIPLNDRGTLTSFWGLFWILVCLHQLYFGWFMVRSSFVPYVMDGNETFSVWWHAHNLYTFSFWKSFGLTDESYGVTEASHPFFHTHQGNMPRLFGFLIYALGARTVEAQVLVTTLIIGNLTLFFCYASIAKVTRPAIALIFCLFLFSDYLLYAQWHVVTYRVWYGFLFFGTLFAISSASAENRIWPYLLLGVLFFLLFYFELVFAGYVSIVAGFLGLWLHWGKPKRIAKLYSIQVMGLVTGVGLLFVQLVLALGFDVVKADFSTTFLARNAAVSGDATSSVGAFFRDHNIVFWMNFRDGSLLRAISAFLRSIGTAVFQIWTPAFYVLVAAPFVGVMASFFERGPNWPGFKYSAAPARAPTDNLAASGNLGRPIFGPLGILVQYAGVAAISAGVCLVVLEMLKSGLLFGIPVTSPVSYPRWILVAAMNTSLVALFAGYFFGPSAVRVPTPPTSIFFLLLTVVCTALVIFEVPLPSLIGRMTVRPDLTMTLGLIAMSLSGAVLAVGYFVIPSLLPVLRGTIACVLISFIVAKSPLLFDQNYSDIWLTLFENSRVRIVVRIAALIAAGTGISVAFFGARRSFGPSWRAAIGRAMALFLVAFAGYAVIYVLSPGYVLSGYAERLAPFAIFFLIFIPAIAVCAMAVAGHRCWIWFLRSEGQTGQVAGRVIVPTCLVFAVATICLLWVRVQTYYASILPPNHAAFAKSLSLPPFAGASFAVNNYAAVVAYYTRSWAYIDGTLARPSIDPLGSVDERLTDRTYHWFADWNSNGKYRHPRYYACMKMPTFDSVLALRDPKRFGQRFSFCDSEAAAWANSPFYDRVIASDAAPARFWSVVWLGGVRPEILDISTSVQSRGGEWSVEGKLAVKSSPAYPVTSRTVELLTGSDAACDATEAGLKVVQTRTDDAPFRLPLNFVGRFQLRAQVESSANESEFRSGDVWISRPNGTGTGLTLLRCPSVLADGPFPSSGLFNPETGWGGREAWGVWTIGPQASLRSFPVPRTAANSDFFLEAEVRGFVPGPGKKQSVSVLANGIPVANWTFSVADWRRAVTALIPKSVMTGHSSLSISFEVADPVSPASLGLSADSRVLGIGLERLTIREVTP
jgi:hypothetical protein